MRSRTVEIIEVCTETEKLLESVKKLENCIDNGEIGKILAAMGTLREAADNLEGLVPYDLWPLPSYAEMMFKI